MYNIYNFYLTKFVLNGSSSEQYSNFVIKLKKFYRNYNSKIAIKNSKKNVYFTVLIEPNILTVYILYVTLVSLFVPELTPGEVMTHDFLNDELRQQQELPKKYC